MTPKTKKWLGAAIKALMYLEILLELPSTERSLSNNLDKKRIDVSRRLITNVLRHNGYWYNFETQRLSKLRPLEQDRKTFPEPNLTLQDEDEGESIQDRLFVALHKADIIMTGSEIDDFLHDLMMEGATVIKTDKP
jgi:hypothetical protein